MKKSYAQALTADGTMGQNVGPPSAAPSATEQSGEEASDEEFVSTKSKPKKLLTKEMSSLKARATELSDTIASLPEGELFDAARKDLQTKLEHAKSNIVKSHPPGAQLDSCVMAIQRAQKRRAQAAAEIVELQKKMEEATRALEDEDLNILHLQASKMEIESAVAAALPSEGSSGAQSHQPPCSMDMSALLVILSSMVDAQRQSQAVSPEIMEAAKGQIEIMTHKSAVKRDAAKVAAEESGMEVDIGATSRRQRAKIPESGSAPFPHVPSDGEDL